MEILWFCRQIVKGGTKHTCGKFCSVNVEAGEEYTAYTIENLTLLYQVQLRLFAIAGLSISRTVTFGKLAEKVVTEKNWSCYHPAYYARKFPSGLLPLPSHFLLLGVPVWVTEKELTTISRIVNI